MIWRFKITESPRSPYMVVHGLIKGSDTDKISRYHEENLTRKNKMIESFLQSWPNKSKRLLWNADEILMSLFGSFKDTSTIPFSGGNDSKLIKYSDKIHWKYFWSNLVPMTSSAKIFKIFILPPSHQWDDFFQSRLASKWPASYKL